MLLTPHLGPMSFTAYEDNTGTIDLSKTPLISSNSRHIDVRHHVLGEVAVSGNISVQYIQSEDQHADIPTRALGRNRLEKHRDFLLERV